MPTQVSQNIRNSLNYTSNWSSSNSHVQGVIHPSSFLWRTFVGFLTKHQFLRAFKLQKKEIRLIAQINLRENWPALKKLTAETLPFSMRHNLILSCPNSPTPNTFLSMENRQIFFGESLYNEGSSFLSNKIVNLFSQNKVGSSWVSQEFLTAAPIEWYLILKVF